MIYLCIHVYIYIYVYTCIWCVFFSMKHDDAPRGPAWCPGKS